MKLQDEKIKMNTEKVKTKQKNNKQDNRIIF